MEKGPLGEFSPACRPGSGGKKGFQSGGKYRRGAVALNLYRVLAGIGVRPTGVHCQTLVNDPAFPVPEDQWLKNAATKKPLRAGLTAAGTVADSHGIPI